MNKESDQMAEEIERLASELHKVQERKDDKWYERILKKDYEQDLYDTQHTHVKKLELSHEKVIRNSISPDRNISE